MRLVQYRTEGGERRVAMVESEETLRVLDGTERVYDLARAAGRSGRPMTALVEERLGSQRAEYGLIAAQKRLLPPLDHPDPTRLVISGTGLDHLGSAQARDAMHQNLKVEEEETLTDSMRMFRLGLEGGKPAPGQVGVAPEWFYKGDGRWLVPPEQPLTMPAFALEGSEEPELVGCYVIGDDGAVLCVGYALGNEFADHVLEKKNYLYLAHSKLRQSSCGPELLLGDPPAHIEGTSRILRDGRELWSAPFLTGEANMTHSLANIQHHHFKYAPFRTPGDVHLHFYGTATLSFAAGIQTEVGDVFEISAPGFGRPLRNELMDTPEAEQLVEIRTL